jgi:hypothetical protein
VAKKQTRRSISVKGITYARAIGYCQDNGISVSGLVERLVTNELDARGAPVLTKYEAEAIVRERRKNDSRGDRV